MDDQENLGSEESMEDTIRNALRGQEEVTEDGTEETTEEVSEVESQEGLVETPFQESPVTETQPDPNDKAPSTWKPETTLEWKNLPPSVKAEIHRREQDFHNGIKTYKDAASFGGEIAKECQPYEAVLRHHGFTPASVMRDAMSMLYTLSAGNQEQKLGVIKTIADQYGIQLEAAQQPQAQSQIDPIIQQKLETFEQYMKRSQQETKQREEQAQQMRIQEASSEIEKFGSDAARSEFFPVVRKHMGALLASGEAKDLADAYDQAVWANPVTRAKLQAQQLEADRKAAAEKAKEAKRAGSNVKPKGTLPAAKATGSMDDTIREQLRKLSG